MKIVFEGESLNDIHKQIILAAKEVQTTPVVSFDTQSTWKDQPEIDTHSGMALNIPPMKTTGVEAAPQVTSQPFAMPDSNGNVPAGTQKDRIDGYVVSDGKVWVPVEGRASAYTGVEIDEYHRRKNAAGELDTEGKPYDPAIHSSTKSKTTKGVWKKKKQFGDKAEATAAVQTQPASPVVAATQPAQPQIPSYDQGPAAIGRAPEMHNLESFKKNLQMILVRLTNSGKLTREYMGDLNRHFQVTNLWDVAQEDVKAKALFDAFVQYQYIIGV